MLATVNPSKCPEPPSQIILPYIEESANIVYNEASHLLVNCTVLTNKRTIYLSNSPLPLRIRRRSRGI